MTLECIGGIQQRQPSEIHPPTGMGIDPA